MKMGLGFSFRWQVSRRSGLGGRFRPAFRSFPATVVKQQLKEEEVSRVSWFFFSGFREEGCHMQM